MVQSLILELRQAVAMRGRRAGGPPRSSPRLGEGGGRAPLRQGPPAGVRAFQIRNEK